MKIGSKDYSFTVIMPVYYGDDPEKFERAFSSVLEQSLPPNQVILVYDGQVNPEIAFTVEQRKDERFKVVQLPENVGLSSALNAAIAQVTTPWIARVDSDDVNHVQRFQCQFDFLKKNPKIDLLGTQVQEFVHNGNILRKTLPETHDQILKFSRFRNPFNHPTVVYSKSKIDSVGGYKHFKYLEDYCLWCDLLVKGCKVANLPDVLVDMTISEGTAKRRAGMVYFLSELQLQVYLWRLKHISFLRVGLNICLRALPRLIGPRVLNFAKNILFRA